MGTVAALDFGDPQRPVGIVFLHANGFNAATYRTLLSPLAQRTRVLAIDQRGHGLTTLGGDATGRHDWYDLRDDLLVLLAVLDLQDVVLAGHSMGGTVSLLAAARAPDRIRRLVLLDPVISSPGGVRTRQGEVSPLMASALRRRATFPDRASAIEAYEGRGAFRTWPREVLADYVEDGFLDLPAGGVTLACTPAWEASGFQAQGHDSWGAFERSICPINILRAEIDTTCALADGIEPLTASGRITVETVPGTSHFLPMERPDVCRHALTQALDSPKGSGRV